MTVVEQRGVEYTKTSSPQAILNGGNAWVSFTSGPTYYNKAQIAALLSTTPWPLAPVAPTDYVNAPSSAPYNIEVGVVFQISNFTGTSIGGYVRVEIVNRTTSTVLATLDKQGSAIVTAPSQVSGAVVLTGSINSTTPVSLMYADDPPYNAAAGDHIGVRVTNALDTPATITVGQLTGGGVTYSPIIRMFEFSYSTDPATALPTTSTPNTPPVAISSLVNTAVVSVLSGSVTVTHNGTPTTYTSGDHNAVVGDTVVTGANTYVTLIFFDGSSRDLDPSTTTVLTAMAQTPGGGQSLSFADEAGQTWNRVMRLIDAQSRYETTTASSAAMERGEYQISKDGSGNHSFSVLDGSVQVN